MLERSTTIHDRETLPLLYYMHHIQLRVALRCALHVRKHPLAAVKKELPESDVSKCYKHLGHSEPRAARPMTTPGLLFRFRASLGNWETQSEVFWANVRLDGE
jgi:hypothetical protein